VSPEDCELYRCTVEGGSWGWAVGVGVVLVVGLLVWWRWDRGD
jgi:hypothetical protein